jgi:hypothetical protein
MTEQIKYTLEEANQYFAVACNNKIWKLLEKKESTEDEQEEMINLAHASLLHWSKSPHCKKVNLQRGEYLISMAYIHAGRKEQALYYAERCKKITEDRREENEDFEGAFGISFILIYFLMVLLYNDFVYPFVVLFAIPMSFIGAFLALAIAKSSLSIFTLMGLVVMMGLVCKNSILIVDFANKEKEQGKNSYDALIAAGKERLRPILMTTIAMVLGMLPIAMASGAGSEWKNGLGWSLVGGLTSSMCLTVFIVPCVYMVVDTIKAKISSRETKPFALWQRLRLYFRLS